jgi:predicted component of type VI protein secretion system
LRTAEVEEITQLDKMNEATITLKITVSSKSILPNELHNALFSLSGGLAAQIYDHLRDKMPELVTSEDFETDWLMRINACKVTDSTKLEAVRAS